MGLHRGMALALAALLLAAAGPAGADFTAFESGHVRPLALAPGGDRLFAVNTPDNRLEIYEVTDGGLLHLAGVPVGLEPVAVAARTDGEVWVVNHLSDSISIVDVAAAPPRVVRTLLVGDEPSDLVFAGPGGNRAFVTTARRGQNDLSDPLLTTPGQGRARVWVFDATDPGAAAGGTPLTVITLFGDKPRGLARNADGSVVYAAVFHSGNRTTTIPTQLVHANGLPGGLGPLEPNTNHAGVEAPFTGLIAKFSQPDPNLPGQWLDAGGQNWSSFVPFHLPDEDVFAIDANAETPAELAAYPQVGAVLFNLAVNPANGHVYVSGTDADNEVRFEGPGTYAASLGLPGPHTVRGNLHRYRISVIDPNSATVTPRHLNKHIDYGLDPNAAEAAGFKDHSLAIPLELAVRSDGSRLYVAAFGSSKVGVFDPAALEADSFTPSDADHIEISGGGPSGLVLDEPRERLYVMGRFDHAIKVVDTTAPPGIEVLSVPLPHDPEPASLRAGRPFLYDARLTSANGEASCASCHVFGNMDDLAWDLGNPDGDVLLNKNKQAFGVLSIENIITLVALNLLNVPDGFFPEHHPMKGPMLTQSLRGMANAGPMHWRGDRSGGAFREDPQSLDEEKAFKAFNVAFEGLLGRTGPLSTAEMQAFTDFVLQLEYPPNPIRALDNSRRPGEANALDIYLNVETDGTVGGDPSTAFTCNECHTLNVNEPNGGFFGTDGDSSFEGETQIFKIPHLRNVYDRIGMFGIVGTAPAGSFGDQIRGYGLLHDGTVDTPFSFVSGAAFTFPGSGAQNVQNRRDMEQLMLTFDADLAPIVGQQVSLDDAGSGVPLLPGGPTPTTSNRIGLLVARGGVSAPRPECDLVVKGIVAGEPRGWFMSSPGVFVPDRASESNRTEAYLRGLAATPGQPLTWTCVPPGSGYRVGIDRNDDGIVDGSQCGDLNGDGLPGDADLLRRALAGTLPAGLLVPAKCNVIGAADAADSNGDGLRDDCTVQDWAVLARAASGLPPGPSQVCAAAL